MMNHSPIEKLQKEDLRKVSEQRILPKNDNPPAQPATEVQMHRNVMSKLHERNNVENISSKVQRDIWQRQEVSKQQAGIDELSPKRTWAVVCRECAHHESGQAHYYQ